MRTWRGNVTTLLDGARHERKALELELEAIRLMKGAAELAAANRADPDVVSQLNRTKRAAEDLARVVQLIHAHPGLSAALDRRGVLGGVLAGQRAIESELARLRVEAGAPGP